MADEKTYPRVVKKAWFLLRARLEASPSLRLTPEFAATVCNMASAKSANDNVLAGMRHMGLIDKEGNLLERGKKWRVPSTYAEACQEIVDEVYPAELASFVDDDGNADIAQIISWFHLHGFGSSNAKAMANTYAIVARKQIEEATAGDAKAANGARPVKQAARKAPQSRRASATPPPTDEGRSDQPSTPLTPNSRPPGPNVHLDIQIHIPADATADQIEQIFASMSKHLYGQ